MQVPISSPNQQKNNNYPADEYSLHRSPFGTPALDFILSVATKLARKANSVANGTVLPDDGSRQKHYRPGS
jgi:hypothetical protein